MKVNWFAQLVDSSAFERPNEIRQAVRDWLSETTVDVDRHIVWDDDAPYPTTLSFCGIWVPEFYKLLDSLQEFFGETEYMVFARVGDNSVFDHPIMLYVVTKTLIAEAGGPAMVHELVRQLQAAAAPAAGSEE